VALRMRVFLPVLAVAALLAVPAANAGLLDPVTSVLAPVTNTVLPTCGSNGYPFAQFGDRSPYYAFTNNGFESGSYGWSLTGGAYVGSGNEPWFVNGWGSRSLVLPSGASATSPGFCINLLDPAIRMFARGSAGGDLKVQVLFRGATGNLLGILNYGDVTGTGAWEPTARISSQLGLLVSYAQIRVTSASGTWQVDDAFVDPCISMIG
jgi:hypothetical protein